MLKKYQFPNNNASNTATESVGYAIKRKNRNRWLGLGFQRRLNMEATEGLFDKIRPPRLEDAGLEECALPPESIKEAFLKAASAVRSHAASILSPSDEEADANCVEDPWPSVGESYDTLIGITPETEPPGGCASKKGCGVPDALGDKVKAGLSDAVAENETVDKVVGPDTVQEEGESCVDELQGLKIVEMNKKLKDDENEEDESQSEGPILTEGYV